MNDAYLRKIIDPPLGRVAQFLYKTNITANRVTITGFVIGMMVIPFLALQQYQAALIVILINRFADGLDGAIARHRGISDFGGYLDIVLDFIFYSAVIFGFCLALPDQAVFGAFLIFSFIGTGSSFLAFSIFAAKRKISTTMLGTKSIYYLGGLTEGFETILVFILMCLLPQWFWLIAGIFAALCWITTMTRIMASYDLLLDKE